MAAIPEYLYPIFKTMGQSMANAYVDNMIQDDRTPCPPSASEEVKIMWREKGLQLFGPQAAAGHLKRYLADVCGDK